MSLHKVQNRLFCLDEELTTYCFYCHPPSVLYHLSGANHFLQPTLYIHISSFHTRGRLFFRLGSDALHDDHFPEIGHGPPCTLVVQTAGGAGLRTDAAIDTGKGVAGPEALFLVYSDALGRALANANRTENALIYVVIELSSAILEWFTDGERVRSSGFRGDQIFQNSGGHG
jgi:hypothetical protein